MLHAIHLTPERRRRLVGLCATITGDRSAAEDLAQETLLEAWRSAHKVHDTSGLDRWLAAIARNVCRRWARRRGRDLSTLTHLETAPPEQGELEDCELVQLLDQALGTLPPETRDALVERYVNDRPRAEIAARLGLSEDAVSMRLARGKAVLRTFLTESDWSDTRVWCTQCARQKLVMRRESGGISFRCPACHPGADELAIDLRLDNPAYARLVGDLVRPAAIFRRVREWSARYFDAHDEAECTRCRRPATVRAHTRDDVPDDPASALGLLARCGSCGQEAWSSVAALAHGRPELEAFRRRHPRLRTLRGRELGYSGSTALLVRCEDALGSSAADVIFARETLRVLAVHGAAG
jgi:RNA polymerase sigma-70 factor (ECF subfamily)